MADGKKDEGLTEPTLCELDKDRVYRAIIILIAIVWAGTWLLNRDYVFWPGIAGILTIPLLLIALAADSYF